MFQAAAADLQAGSHAEQQQQLQQQGAWDGGSAPCIDGSSSSLEVTPEVVAAVWDRLLPGKRCSCTTLASLQGTCIGGFSRAAVTAQCVHVAWVLICSTAMSSSPSDAGLLGHYDAPQSLPLIAPRPLLVANGELDPRCPMEVRDRMLAVVFTWWAALAYGCCWPDGTWTRAASRSCSISCCVLLAGHGYLRRVELPACIWSLPNQMLCDGCCCACACAKPDAV